MGNLFDVASFNLTNSEGQQRALDELFANHNDVYDRSAGTVSYQVVAYTQLSIDLINGNPTAVYTATYNHGLGYPPQVLAFGLQPTGGSTFQYAALQYQEIQFFPGGAELAYQYYSVDAQNLVYKVHAVNNGGLFVSTHYSGAFYIFNLPLNNLS